MAINPFAPNPELPTAEGYFGDFASCEKKSFLYRVLSIRYPCEITLVYDGWWFRQRITMDAIPVWSKISWVTIEPRVEFSIPDEVLPGGGMGRMEIQFSRGLLIRNFRVWINDFAVYDGK